jgi:hypothetical protein
VRRYDVLCLNTNYHLEHHDFPRVGLLDLPRVRALAPEFYSSEEVLSGDHPFRVIAKAFTRPEFYACMGTAAGVEESAEGADALDDDDSV